MQSIEQEWRDESLEVDHRSNACYRVQGEEVGNDAGVQETMHHSRVIQTEIFHRNVVDLPPQASMLCLLPVQPIDYPFLHLHLALQE